MTLEGTHQTSKATLPAPGQYRLMPELTTVRFAAKKFGLFTIRGTMALTTGTAAVTAPPESSTLHATLAANSFRTPMARRDEHVKGPKLIDSASFPTIDFDSTRVEPTAGGWTIHGLLTVHGISEPIALDVRSALRDGELLRARATARIDRRDFGVTKFRFAAASRIDIDMDVAAEPVHR